MGWFSKFRLTSGVRAAVQGPVPDAESLQQTRVRSRRRLMGAVVLVVIAVIGFPLIFETQPRPVSVDIPIEIPSKEGLPLLVVPASRVAAPAIMQTPSADAASAPSAAAERVTSAVQAAPITVPTTTTTATPALPVAKIDEDVGAAERAPPGVALSPPLVPLVPGAKAADKPASSAPATSKLAVKPGVAADSGRAKALLEGSPSAKADGLNEAGRFVVQVGAFAEHDAARQTRLKVEKLGLKTYVQVAQTPDGKRIRVRVGPYVSKDEAEKAKTKLTAGGFPAVLLTL